jgi:hypothetical protein
MAQQQMASMGQVPQEQQQQAMVAMMQQHPMMSQPVMQNDVAQMLVDIVIDKSPETAVIEQEEFEKLNEIAGIVIPNRPDMAQKMIELVVRASQLRDKQDLLDALTKAPDPQQAQLQQQQQQLAMKDAEAEVGVKSTQAQLNAARAQAEQAKTQIAGQKAPAEIAKVQAEAVRTSAQAGAAAAWPQQEGFQDGVG